MQSPKTTLETGSWKFHFIDDGIFDLSADSKFSPFQKEHTPDRYKIRIGFMVVHAPTGTYLVDLGLGSYPDPLFSRTAASNYVPMRDKLKNENFTEISGIIFSHLHVDHFGGYMEYVNELFQPNFPDIPCYISEKEWNFRLSRLDKYNDHYKKYIERIKPQIILTQTGQEILPGIEIFCTGGHTPGHQTVLFHTAENDVLYSGDLIATETQLAKNRSLPYDFDIEEAKLLREKIYTEAAKNDWIFALNHSPHNKFSQLDKNKKK